jgi:hypothetical protein
MEEDNFANAQGMTPMTNMLVGEDIFQGLSNKELLCYRREAAREIFTGVVQSSSAGDTTATRFAKISPLLRIRMINKTLWLRDPVAFPMNQPVKRTRPWYVYG